MFSFLRLKKRADIPLVPCILMVLIACVGFLQLYSSGRGLHPWASAQMIRFGLGAFLFLIVTFIDLRFWLFSSSIVYIGCLGLLILVELLGATGMGAKRWINLYVIQLQPSEMMKFGLVLFLSAYCHFLGDRPLKGRKVLMPFFVIGLAAALVLRQPDLGTALILLFSGVTIVFAAGLSWWYFVAGLGLLAAGFPVVWSFLKAYQKKRIFTFLNPEADPLGAGYHTLQSKIAIGSGGFSGKGFCQGSQVQLNFLPEKQTDFIFTVLCEEWGFLSGLFLILLYMGLVAYGYSVALNCQARFSKLLVVGVTSTLFAHVFVNMGMVMGVLPIVGVPLPFMSYGGTSLLTFMVGLGWVVAADRQRRVRLPLSSMSDPF